MNTTQARNTTQAKSTTKSNKSRTRKKAQNKNAQKAGISWAQKLTSRKFWLSLATFISMMVIAFGGSQDRATQITSIIMAGGATVAYVIGEGFADAARADTNESENENENEDEE